MRTCKIPQIEYNVFCICCGRVWTPAFKSPTWWKAHKKAQKGYLDACGVSGEECGCDPKQELPKAQIRVFGYTMDCQRFDVPCRNVVEAVQAYRQLARCSTIMIKGVCSKVEQYLESNYW